MITFGNTSVDISLIAVFAAILTIKLLPTIAFVWFVIQGFRVHWGWGVANLLIPGAFIPFCFLHPKKSKGPLILLGISLVIFFILWMCARHGSSSGPKIEVAPALSAPATNAVLYLQLTSYNKASRRGCTDSGSLSQENRVLPAAPSYGIYNEERLMAIQADGFVIRFTDRVGDGMQTNFILFPYGRITETNILGWNIVGDYNGKVTTSANAMPEPAADNTFHLLTTNAFTKPAVGSGQAVGR